MQDSPNRKYFTCTCINTDDIFHFFLFTKTGNKKDMCYLHTSFDTVAGTFACLQEKCTFYM